MSEPTYRVDLSHRPEEIQFPWRAIIVRLTDDVALRVFVGESKEDAFAHAVKFVYDISNAEQQEPYSVYLSEDGDLLDQAS